MRQSDSGTGWTVQATPVALLVAGALRGDESSRLSLVRRSLPRARTVAMRVVRHREEAEEVVQDAFLLAFKRLHTCREPERFESWLLQIVRNCARNRLGARSLQAEEEWFLSDDPTQLRWEAVGLRGRMAKALETLSPTHRRVVVLHDVEGWSHREIAQALALTEVNSRQHLFQSHRTLRRLLQDCLERAA